MNISDVQKMNALASELRKNHFAGSSVDAFQQAQDIVNTRQDHSQVIPSREHVVQDQSALFEKRFQLILDMNNKKYEQEFALLRSALNQLANEFSSVRGELEKARSQIQEAPKVHKEVQQPLKTEVKEAHPRQGNFTSSDVDIKKMFYFGSKK